MPKVGKKHYSYTPKGIAMAKAAAKKKGASEEMIKEMIDVMGMANQNNKLVEAYGVEVDEIYK